MQTYIETLIARQQRLTEQRVERALALMKPLGQEIFHQLPLLLHFNHSELPGFVEGAPSGIKQFHANKKQREWMAQLTLRYPLSTSNQGNILGLYSMGSTSSIGQTVASDLDIWVCIPENLPAEKKALLQQKCDALTEWALQFYIEANFFLMEQNRFRDAYSEEMTGDNCGSSQHLLLLDEFYRTAVCLGGQQLLWQIIPPEMEESYDDYVDQLCEQGIIQRDQWIDFGRLNHIPAEEYFGSSLWQLYKSIDSPFKSVLKAILLEAYSWEYPHTQLLSIDSKRRFFADDPDLYGMDAYYLMLEKVTRYLERTNDMSRLELVRRSFYLKTHEKLSRRQGQGSVEWRRKALSELTTQWGWSSEYITELDSRRTWKVEQVKKSHHDLLEALMQSYRNLIRFARNNDITSSISPEDISILARKLYAAFEELPGKVTLLNPQISPDLHEADLSFIEVPEDSINKAGWYVYKKPLIAKELMGAKFLEHNRYLSKLVAWAFFNGLLTESTRLDAVVRDADLNIDKFYQMVSDLRNTFSVYLPQPTKEELGSPCEVRQLSIFINLENDPTERLKLKPERMNQADADIFSCGSEQNNLIGSVDLVYRNSWHEVRTLNFSGETAILDALKTVLCKMHQDAARPESVDVFCYSKQMRGIIRNNIYQLLAECIELRLKPVENNEKRRRFKGIKIGSTMYGLFFERRGVSIQKLEDSVQFYSSISTNKAIGSTTIPLGDNSSVVIPDAVDSFASEGLIQFFFDDSQNDDDGFNIYVLDEENKIEIYHQCYGSKDDMVNSINHYYTSSRNNEDLSNPDKVNFNLPQFYEVVYGDTQEASIHSYRSGQQHAKVKQVI
ncbi:class I adenylate cyclase [Aliivibrio fischeri]|uniref:class I adenylate cyclase n=1 Tax=Aliivibrio fischeri TaxID=668 RepID=UPI0007C4E38D|nr:class I adenylate cyclase [Aliivibrio fischeri]MBP3140562.1 class I adenylate cyclase [Aliivibrio fischeri]MBP3156120.1 class I adenylate cyclase [Aliivibrio fischeri]MCE7574741.1 class I adenylate cyclase [Aliivibrio fischeri]